MSLIYQLVSILNVVTVFAPPLTSAVNGFSWCRKISVNTVGLISTTVKVVSMYWAQLTLDAGLTGKCCKNAIFILSPWNSQKVGNFDLLVRRIGFMIENSRWDRETSLTSMAFSPVYYQTCTTRVCWARKGLCLSMC